VDIGNNATKCAKLMYGTKQCYISIIHQLDYRLKLMFTLKDKREGKMMKVCVSII